MSSIVVIIHCIHLCTFSIQAAASVGKCEAKLDRTRTCASECKHEREVKLVMLELEKLREKIARLEGGISKGEMLFFKVIYCSMKFDSG